MASYIEITDEETDPGAPVTSELLKRERDNPIAIAEGATGAPRILGAALIPEENVLAEFTPLVVSAADTNKWEHNAGVTDSLSGSTAIVYPSGSTYILAQSYTVLGYTGTARVKFLQYGAAGESGTYYSEMRVNGAPVASWSIDYPTAGELRSYDVTVAPGDLIEIYHRDTGSVHGHISRGIYSNKSLYRLGALATRG